MRGNTFEEVKQRLERELAARNGNKRQLARDAAADGANPETLRRTVYRILSGVVPEPETSAALERGLGKKPGYFTVAPVPRPEQAKRAAPAATVDEHTVAIDALREAVLLLLRAVTAAGVAVPDLPPAALPPGAGGSRS